MLTIIDRAIKKKIGYSTDEVLACFQSCHFRIACRCDCTHRNFSARRKQWRNLVSCFVRRYTICVKRYNLQKHFCEYHKHHCCNKTLIKYYGGIRFPNPPTRKHAIGQNNFFLTLTSHKNINLINYFKSNYKQSCWKQNDKVIKFTLQNDK